MPFPLHFFKILNCFRMDLATIKTEERRASQHKQNCLFLQLNNLITAKVKCQIFLYNKVDVKRLQLPTPTTGEDLLLTDWLTPIEFGIGEVKPVK